MAIFPTFFLCNIGQENVFFDILERKNTFLGYKNMKSKKSKNWHFSKGLTHGFGPKMAIFPTFYFYVNIDYEKVLYDILERKNAFRSYKNKKLKKSRKIDIFPKGLIHGFGPKMAIFPTFFLGNIGEENVFYDILERKKCLSRLQKQEVQKVEKFTFF